MAIAGWPMRTPSEQALIDLAQLPMAGAVLVGIVEMTWARRLWLRSPVVFFGVFGPAFLALTAGIVCVAIAYGPGPRSLSGTGQLAIWLAVGFAFVYLAVDSLRRERVVRTEFLEEIDEDDADPHDRIGLDDWTTEDPETGESS